MNRLLVCSTPAPGHFNPMVTIASSLAKKGYDVTFLTSEVFRSRVERDNLRFVPFKGKANFDYRQLDAEFTKDKLLSGPEQVIYDFKYIFGDSMPDQYQGVQQILSSSPIDLILADTTFLGTIPLLLDPDSERPPVIGIGVLPLLITSKDRPPMGAPAKPGDPPRDYNEEHRSFQTLFQPVDEHLNCILSDLGCPSLPSFFLDSLHCLPDRYLQLTGESFEYPCRDLPSNIRFVGPLVSKSTNSSVEESNWWDALDCGRPIVLVTQGTIANRDFSELIEPTLVALAGEDVSVIASLATDEPRAVQIDVPPNAAVVPFVPFEKLFPKISLFITNGGYGAVSQALQFGVPMIVAGATEDKPFVAARVAWSGCGLDLQTNRPSPEAIRAAASAILADNSFRANAVAMSQSFRKYNALDTIAAEVQQAINRSAAHQTPSHLSLA